MSSNAAFHEALDEYEETVRKNDYNRKEWPYADVITARARVLALYAERQGEVYEVREWEYPDGRSFLAVIFPKGQYENGDKVRVTKVEEGQ